MNMKRTRMSVKSYRHCWIVHLSLPKLSAESGLGVVKENKSSIRNEVINLIFYVDCL